MKDKIFFALQVLAGLMLVVFGLNKFLSFMAMPPMSPEMGEYMTALFKTGFIFPIIAVIEILAGIAFITNKYVSLMVIIVMPVMVNATLAHLFLDPAGIGGGLFIVLVLLSIIYNHRSRYSQVFKA